MPSNLRLGALQLSPPCPVNVLGKRDDHASEMIKTRARRVLHLLLIITQQSLVTMPSETEGRISLALQAYTGH
jgi:hypothetical protein